MNKSSFDLWYNAFCGGVFGAITASFLCVVAERVPRGLSLGGRSHCVCGRQLLWRENIPVLGWLRVGGVSRCCSSKIPVFYLVAELFLAAGWAVSGYLVRDHLVAGVALGFCAAGAVVAIGVRSSSSSS
jgi:prepilin signal peptidase PulO-like enzyme (type II secretory pathway)